MVDSQIILFFRLGNFVQSVGLVCWVVHMHDFQPILEQLRCFESHRIFSNLLFFFQRCSKAQWKLSFPQFLLEGKPTQCEIGKKTTQRNIRHIKSYCEDFSKLGINQNKIFIPLLVYSEFSWEFQCFICLNRVTPECILEHVHITIQ